jgi:hypothetical protein
VLRFGMTKSAEEVALAGELLTQGLSKSAVARQLQVSRAALRDWQTRGFEATAARRLDASAYHLGHELEPCPLVGAAPEADYSYLLGLYLGDGCLTEMPRRVFKCGGSTCRGRSRSPSARRWRCSTSSSGRSTDERRPYGAAVVGVVDGVVVGVVLSVVGGEVVLVDPLPPRVERPLPW